MAPTICTEDEARVRSSIRDSRKRLQGSSNSLSSSVINYVGRSTHKQTGSVRSGAKVNRSLSQMSDEVIAATATTEAEAAAAAVKDPPSVLSIPATTATAVLPGARGRDDSDIQDDLYSVSSNNSKDVDEVQYNFHDEEDSMMAEVNDGSDMEDNADNQCTDLKSLGASRRTGNYIHKQRHPHKIIKAKYKRQQGKADSPTDVMDSLESERYYGDSVIVRLDHNPVGPDDNSIASTFSTSSSMLEDYEITSPYTPTPCLSSPVKSNNTKGLLDIAVKTVKLIKRNQMLQKKLSQLQFETRAFIESVLSNPENQAIREKIQSGRTKQIEA